jgi:hypothetical protein
MGKLYIFGCSFSAKYDNNTLNDLSIKRYYDYRGQNFPLTWSELLANNLKLNLINTARWGANNYEIFENFCNKSSVITKDDIVLIGWTGINRFRLHSELFNQLTTINVWGKIDNTVFPNISQNTIDEILANRDNTTWVNEIRSYMNLIDSFSNVVGFKTIHWSLFDYIPEISILNTLLNLGAEYITHETNGEIINEHMGEIGHQKQAKYFEDIISNKQKIRLI